MTQYDPIGQMFASVVCDGVAVCAFRTQKYPAAHSPRGAVSPGVSQYSPPLHELHWLLFCSCVCALYVPTGHGYCVATRVPRGQ